MYEANSSSSIEEKWQNYRWHISKINTDNNKLAILLQSPISCSIKEFERNYAMLSARQFS